MVDIVTAGPDDWPLVKDIRLRALADAPDAFGMTLAQSAAQPDEEWRERLSGPSPTVLALDDGRPVAMGGGFLVPDSDVAMVWGMWTEPAARGRGLGRRILATVVDWAHGAGRTPYLHVTEGNEVARAAYVAAGFEPTGTWEPLREGSPLRIEEMVLRRG